MYPAPRFPDPHPKPGDRPDRPDRRIGKAHLAAIAGVSLAALGLVTLNFVSLPAPDPVATGDGLKIEVVAPVEPKPVPGSVMEVGELIDGFRFVRLAPAERVPAYDVAWAEDEVAPIEPRRRESDVRRYASSDAEPGPVPEPEPLRERSRRWFGFDNPLPDYAAERRARQDRMEALEEQRRADFEGRRRYRSDPPVQHPVDEATDGPYGPEVG